ncbi:MAG TPA: hypothetical protein VH231_10255, partial [Solirubrobacteraceae bacterium]|nr:hypothetical protein [Solirubrobacteraceae bacterium]
MVERLGDERACGVIIGTKGPARQLEGDHGVDQSLLGAVVEVSLDLPTRRVRGRDDARTGCGELGTALRIRNRGAGKLR